MDTQDTHTDAALTEDTTNKKEVRTIKFALLLLYLDRNYLIFCSFFMRSISDFKSSLPVPDQGLTPAIYEERLII